MIGSARTFNSSSRNGLVEVSPWYGLSQKPLTHFGNISLASVPNWYVPFLLSTIKYGLVHRNRGFPGMEPIFIWNTSTKLPMLIFFSFPCRWQSTKDFVFHYFSSKSYRDWSRLSSNSRNCFLLILSDDFSSSCFAICTRKRGIWNSIGIIRLTQKPIETVSIELLFCKSYDMPIMQYVAFDPS